MVYSNFFFCLTRSEAWPFDLVVQDLQINRRSYRPQSDLAALGSSLPRLVDVNRHNQTTYRGKRGMVASTHLGAYTKNKDFISSSRSCLYEPR
jgi:hypothetical protein